MFIPFATDAPLYHRPFATVGLILANLVAFGVMLWTGGDGWMLHYGNGLHPVEWITSTFLHFDLLHLIGNMVFLWVFGLIVEGKLGWWRFLLLYGLLAALDGAVSQTWMLSSEALAARGSGGASGVIYALMAISLVWAPRNDIDVFYFVIFWIWWKTGVFQVSVLVFSLIFIGLDVLLASLHGFEMSSELLHVFGALIGLPIGLAMVKFRLVDCENWDALSLYNRRALLDDFVGPAVLRKKLDDRDPDSAPASMRRKVSSRERAAQFEKALQSGNMLAAWNAYRILHAAGRQKRIDEASMLRLIEGLHRQQDWAPAAVALEDVIVRFPEKSTRPRLMLAGLLVKEQQRPRAALGILQDLDRDSLTDAQRTYVRSVTSAARSQIESGILELASPASASASPGSIESANESAATPRRCRGGQ